MVANRVRLEGQIFGRLTVQKLVIKSTRKTFYLCSCSCGNNKEVRADSLKSGKTKSCGCLNLELSKSKTGSKHPNWKTSCPSSRTCLNCLSNKTSNEFHKLHLKTISGQLIFRLRSICKSCFRAKAKEKYKNNSRYYINFSLRRTRNCTPSWMKTNQIFIDNVKAIYSECFKLNKRDGPRTWHVDHIMPLKGKNSCGLHVPWNLRIIKAEENQRKSNKEPYIS